eukprot:7204787-Prorocentrum_lima.AAC.1
MQDPEFVAYYQRWLLTRPAEYPPEDAPRGHRLINYDAVFTEAQLQEMRTHASCLFRHTTHKAHTPFPANGKPNPLSW